MAGTTEVAVVAGGCFWCVEAIFDRLNGVLAVESGYTGGHVANPTYEQVCGKETGHAEALRIEFDPTIIPLADLYDIFMATHNPTELNRQGNDVGPQYRSAIFPQNAAQEAEAKAAIERARADWADPIVTTIEPAAPWYPAELEHQDYYARIGDQNPYCAAVVTPKVRKFMQKYAAKLKGA